MTNPHIITLREQEDTYLDRDELSDVDAEMIYRRYGEKIEIDVPSMKTDGRWRLRSLGWVGSIPLRSGLHIVLEPKLPVKNIFRMLEYAYRLKSFEILDGVTTSDQLEDVYQRLAVILARRVLDRSRRGFYRSYIREEDQLPYVRGSIDVTRSAREPWNVDLHCAFEEHTADIVDNQVIAWTLYTIARQRICSDNALQLVRKAWRSLRGVVSLSAFRSADCLGRFYNRLNDDYRPLHALCRFFLEGAGPSHSHGEHESLPFLVDMARLYEMYVAEYLAQHLPDGLRLARQQSFSLSEDGAIRIAIDMVLTDAVTGRTLAVLDTKYKDADQPASSDLQQVVAYAVAKNCPRAVLIYPTRLKVPFNGKYGEGGIEVTTTCVSVDGEIGRELYEIIRA